jgi:uncharacterized cupredoxin-like copper-binding protein
MMSTRWSGRALLIAGFAVALLLAACGDSGSESQPVGDSDTTMDMSDTTMDMSDTTMSMEEHVLDWGTPGDPADADRVIAITASDTFRYEPDTVDVSVGETITFRVTNAGAVRHEFIIGTDAEQEEHEEEMASMGDDEMMMDDEPNAVAIEPGETKDLTLTFTLAGPLRFGCHEPGHFAAGMIGDLDVTP